MLLLKKMILIEPYIPFALDARKDDFINTLHERMFLNSRHTFEEDWIGWKNLWNLNASPRVKTFTWLLCHSKIKTYDLLHALNVGPLQNCVLCDLHIESVEHLFNHCI